MSEPHATTFSAFWIAAFASLTGDFSTIVFCALIGTLWPLGNTKTETRTHGALLIIKLTFTSAILTSLVVWLIETYLHVPASKAMGPVALLISAMGERWQGIFDALGSLIAKLINSTGVRQ